MSKPEDHLIRTGDLETSRLALSEMTGLSRLDFELQRIAADGEWRSSPGSERFLYVLEGRGRLHAGDESADLGPGDFLALAAADSAHLETDQGIQFLFGSA